MVRMRSDRFKPRFNLLCHADANAAVAHILYVRMTGSKLNQSSMCRTELA